MAGFELYLRMNLRETAVVTSEALGCNSVCGGRLWRIFTLRHVILLLTVMHVLFGFKRDTVDETISSDQLLSN